LFDTFERNYGPITNFFLEKIMNPPKIIQYVNIYENDYYFDAQIPIDKFIANPELAPCNQMNEVAYISSKILNGFGDYKEAMHNISNSAMDIDDEIPNYFYESYIKQPQINFDMLNSSLNLNQSDISILDKFLVPDKMMGMTEALKGLSERISKSKSQMAYFVILNLK
jgi:hypothetical protein